MSSRSARGYLIPHLVRSLLQRRITVLFPGGPLQINENYRGRIFVDVERCIGCGLCARDCPADALEVERLDGKGVRVRHWYDRCASCGQCELSCRSGALRLDASFKEATASRDDLVVEWVREGPPSGAEED
jgi:formate hydrogenlyase subunit 6/NADH:ubiquinone oxidoreductase subunit I